MVAKAKRAANRAASAAAKAATKATIPKAEPAARPIRNSRPPAPARNIQPDELAAESGSPGPSKKYTNGRKKSGSVQNTIQEIIDASKLPPAEQALLPKRSLNTKAARSKKGRKNNGGGLEPILEHFDVKDDPYYNKPPLPTHIN